ncbi:MAG: hypothetical protein HG423_012805 [Propionibacterium sp.]|nr:hypothetical protein [Propionibacterium sp.]
MTWQLWRWAPMVPELVAWWDVEPREPAGREAVGGWDPRVLFTPQALLPLVFYAFGMAITLVLVRRFQRLPGFRWATVGSLQVLALMAGFATSGWQMVLGLVNVTEDGWFGNPGEFGLDQVTAPLLSCLLTGGYGRWLVTSPRRPRRGLTDQQIWAVVLVPAGLVVAAMLCAVPFSGGMTLAQVIPMLGLYCVGMWLFLHLIRALPGLRTGKLMLINCLMPALAVVQPALALLLGNVPGLGWFARLPLSVFGDVARLLSGVGVELNLGHYGLLPIAESLVVLLIYLYRLRRSAILVRR